jgi:hypothetical protein
MTDELELGQDVLKRTKAKLGDQVFDSFNTSQISYLQEFTLQLAFIKLNSLKNYSQKAILKNFAILNNMGG